MQLNSSSIGIVGTSRKPDERRVPIHPEHLSRLPGAVRRQLVFETGYGAPFGVPDADIAAQSGGIASRAALLADAGSVVIAKPVLADLQDLREGGVLWGYMHCAQQRAITQAAIDRRQTVPSTRSRRMASATLPSASSAPTTRCAKRRWIVITSASSRARTARPG